jgi:acyl-CoA synthetase (AMP-forming)/AMP-acid ligase II
MRLAPAHLIEAYRARGWWTDATVDDLFRRCVRERPAHEALVDPPNRGELVGGAARRLSFGQLGARVDAMSAALAATGLRAGDIVVTQLPNIVEHVELYLAGARLGVILSPLSMLARGFEMRHAIETLRPRAIVSIARFKDAEPVELALECAAESGVPVLAFGDALPEGARSLDRLVADSEPRLAASASRVNADDVYTVCWTSGTEGVPKAVPRSHNQWLAISWAHYEATGISPTDRLLNPFPLINMASIGGCFTSWLHCACTLHLHHPLDLPVFLKQIATERITYTVVPPALLNMLLKDEALAAKADLSSLRCIGSGSAPLSDWMIRGYRDKFGIEIVNLFGSNEGVSLVSGPREAPDPGHRARYFPRFGRADIAWEAKVARMIETKILDLASGAEILEPGKPGELVVRGPTVFSGYLGPEELTRAAFTADGFYRTGDVFEIAGEGEEARFYRYVGRSKQIISRGGMKISPDELDHLLAGHPQLAEGAAVGYPDEILGERVAIVAVPKPGEAPTLDSVRDFLAARGAAVYKLPERLVLAERLPRNAMGKVVRKELTALVGGAPASVQGAERHG